MKKIKEINIRYYNPDWGRFISIGAEAAATGIAREEIAQEATDEASEIIEDTTEIISKIGKFAEVVLNPDTWKIISLNLTSVSKAARLLKYISEY